MPLTAANFRVTSGRVHLHMLACLLMLLLTAACTAPATPTPSPTPTLTGLQAMRDPLACERSSSIQIDYIAGAGDKTPQQAFESFSHPDELPPGNPAYTVDFDEQFTWIYLDNRGVVGRVVAEMLAPGHWVISTIARCED